MTENDYSPLTAACFRANKMIEKRKTAALEIEKMVRDFNSSGNTTQIRRLLKILGQDLCLSQNPNWRKGGLIGLASMSIALQRDSARYTQELVPPIVTSLIDQDSRVKYYACEALYNVVKVLRKDILPLFNEIFDVLSKLTADPDQSVKTGAEHIDRLLKDIVAESTNFDLGSFIPLLRERIYTQKPFARRFVVSWIQLLNDVSDTDVIGYLPDLLDGLFIILSEPTPEIRQLCETILSEFKGKIIGNPGKADLAAMVNILITHSQSNQPLVQFMALTWLKEFVNLKSTLLPFSANLLTAILPCLDEKPQLEMTVTPDANSPQNRLPTSLNITEVARALNYSLMQLVTDQQSSDNNTDANNGGDAPFDISSIIEVVSRELKKGDSSPATKTAVLRWIHHLHQKVPHKITPHLDDLFPKLLKTLSDPSEEVALLGLEVLAAIFSVQDSNRENQFSDSVSRGFFTKFMSELLQLFKSNEPFLDERGSFIIRQLCLQVNSVEIYKSLSEILLAHDDLEFCYFMVQHLNRILFSSSELFELRSQLRDLQTDESCSLFCTLYKTWCHSPVATISLCLLTKNYKHANSLIVNCGHLDITVEFLSEVDQLVQLIESPIFSVLRLHLLDPERNQDLIRTLYGLLMLLPQGSAFSMLRKRLDCVPHSSLSDAIHTNRGESVGGSSSHQPRMDFKELLRHFQEVQVKHQNFRKRGNLLLFDETR